jgi:hypothetical protein
MSLLWATIKDNLIIIYNAYSRKRYKMIPEIGVSGFYKFYIPVSSGEKRIQGGLERTEVPTGFSISGAWNFRLRSVRKCIIC